MLKPLKGRQAHLKLDESCIEKGGHPSFLSTELRGLLAYILDTTIPSGRNTAMVCHACNNGRCSNPYHIYWGTHKENVADAVANGKKSIWSYMVEKHGIDEARRMQGKKNDGTKRDYSKAGRPGEPKTESQKQKIAESINKLYDEGVYDSVVIFGNKKVKPRASRSMVDQIPDKDPVGSSILPSPTIPKVG